MAEKASEIVEAVVRRVLVPAVTGGTLVIERPFGQKAAFAAAEAVGGFGVSEGLAQIERELGPSVLERGEESLLRRIRRIVDADPVAIGPRLEGGVVAAAALFHDLVAGFHPDLPGAFRRDAPSKLLEATANGLASIPAPATLRAAILRHAWLGELPKFSLSRTEVRWWVGGASFVGREPPARLLAWPNVRRVSKETRNAEILRVLELFGDRGDVSAVGELHARAMAAFFASSPLTDLAFAGRLAPPFTWNDRLQAVVSSAAGARVARRAIALGEERGKFAREVIQAQAGEAAAALLA